MTFALVPVHHPRPVGDRAHLRPSARPEQGCGGRGGHRAAVFEILRTNNPRLVGGRARRASMADGGTMTSPITMHLVRHGESRWKSEGATRATPTPDSPRKAVDRQTSSPLPSPCRYQHPMWSSRAICHVVDTAKTYADLVGAEIRLDPALREMSVGDWAGLTFEEAALAHPSIVARVAAGEDLVRGVGGETFADTRRRVVGALSSATADLTDTGDEHVVVVFTSGNPIRLATADVLGIPSPGIRPWGRRTTAPSPASGCARATARPCATTTKSPLPRRPIRGRSLTAPLNVIRADPQPVGRSPRGRARRGSQRAV